MAADIHLGHTTTTIGTPVGPFVMCGMGNRGRFGWFGWFKDDTIEQPTGQWLLAPTAQMQATIADAIQTQTIPAVLWCHWICSVYEPICAKP